MIGGHAILAGDCREVMARLPNGYFAAMVTDPPFGQGMGRRLGKDWDCYRRAHNPADVGRDNVFGRLSRVAPHSYGESDRQAFVEMMTEAMSGARRILRDGAHVFVCASPRTAHWTSIAVEDAGFEILDPVYHLFGTGNPKSRNMLKPAAEHWVFARNGAGAGIDVDGCRVPAPGERIEVHSRSSAADEASQARGIYGAGGAHGTYQTEGQADGRWPPNVAFTHAAECAEACVADCPILQLECQAPGRSRFYHRFRYQAKPGRSEKDHGLDEGNTHPTVKSIDLLRMLVRLVTPDGGKVLDPFVGSGTTLIAACLEGRDAVGIERDQEYLELARRRCAAWLS